MPDQVVKDTLALSRLKERINNCPEQVNNDNLHAGSPMYFYCRMCGHQSDIKPESYTSAPIKICKECQELKDANEGITETTLIQLAKELPDELEESTELEYLEWFRANADFGPADEDVKIMMDAAFEDATGKKVPKGWRRGNG